MWDYEPLTEEDAIAARSSNKITFLPDGEYQLRVVESEEGISGTGNPTIKLKLVTMHEGRERFIYSTLPSTPNMMWYTKHFCDSAGLTQQYLTKQFNARLALNKTVTGKIITKEAQPKNDNSGASWPAKNVIDDWIVNEKQKYNLNSPPNPSYKQLEARSLAELDDDIPF